MADREIIVKIVDQTKSGMASANKNLDSVNKSGNTLIGTFGGLKTAVGAFVGALAVKQLVDFGKAILDATQEYQTYNNQLKLITGNQQELENTMAALTTAAYTNRAAFGDTIDLYSKLRLATESLGVTSEQVIQVTNNFQRALSIAGADAGTAAGAIRQFGQAMASGTVRGDEFNSIVEALGPALIIMSRESGITVGELRKMSQAGELTADVFFRMVENSKALAGAFNDTSVTIDQMNQRFSDSLTYFLNNTTAGEAYNSVLGSLIRSMDIFSERQGAIANMSIEELFGNAHKGAITYDDALAELNASLQSLTGPLDSITARIMLGSKETDEAVETYRYLIQRMEEMKAAAEADAAALKEIQEQQKAVNDAIRDGGSSYEAIRTRIAEYREELEKQKTDEEKALELKQQLTKDIQALEEAIAKYGDSIPDDVMDQYNEALSVTRERLAAVNNQLEPAVASQQELAYWASASDSAYGKFNEQLARSIELAGLEPDARAQQIAANRAVEAAMKDAEKAGRTLSASQIANIKAQTIAQVKASQDARDALEERLEAEREAEKEREERLERQQELIEEAAEMRLDTERSLLNEVERLEKEYQDAVREMREAGVSEHQAYKDLELAYEIKISEAKKDLAEEEARQRQKLIDDTTSEYSNLYGFMGDKLEEFTGVSKKEFGLINDVTKLVFGTDIQGIFDQTFTQGILGVQSMRTNTDAEMKLLSSGVATEMANSTGSVNGFANGTLTTMADWAKSVLHNFGTLGGGIIQVLGTAFEWLTSGFSSVFGSLSSFIGGFFGNITSLIGGIIDIPFMAEGGYIPSGGTAIVGEMGPELVSGPARVTSTDDTADILSGGIGSTMNVTFNINTVDARGFDELLTSRREVITDLVRTAVVESPSRQLRGVY